MPSIQIKDVPGGDARGAAPAGGDGPPVSRDHLGHPRSVPRWARARRRAAHALTDLIDLPLRRAPHRPLLSRCWELRGSLSVHDAPYVALAGLLDVVLVTADARLARAAGPRCATELLGP
jgi:hypothetical protein